MIPSDFAVIAAVVVIAGVALIAVSSAWKKLQPEPKHQSNTPPPCRVSLVPEEHPSWKGEKFIARYLEHFRALGFQTIGAYRIPELDSQRILALFNPTQRFYACVYDSKTHPTFEMFAEFSPDNFLMGTNGSWVRDIDQRPGYITVRAAKSTPAQVLELLRQHEKAGDRLAITADGFAPAFLKAYVQNFNWRLKRTEIGRDQIRLEARAEGRALTNDQLEELYRAKRAAYVAQLQDACRTQYRDDKGIDRREWQRLQNKLFAVPETYDLKEVINAVSYAVPAALNEKQLFALQQMETSLGDDGIMLVTRIMAKNIADLGLKQVGEVKEPVRAWIMVAGEPAAEPEKEEVVPPPPAAMPQKAAA
jgi:hypothetical protein